MAEKMLWNRNRTASVRASKIREITVTETRMLNQDKGVYVVRGWYNHNECFTFGEWTTRSGANRWVNTLHKIIEGR